MHFSFVISNAIVNLRNRYVVAVYPKVNQNRNKKVLKFTKS